MEPMKVSPAASRSTRASLTSSTRKPTTGPVEKCSWSLSPGPNTSTVSPLGSRKTAKSGSSCTMRRPNVSPTNLTVSSNFRVRVPSHTSPLAFMGCSPTRLCERRGRVWGPELQQISVRIEEIVREGLHPVEVDGAVDLRALLAGVIYGFFQLVAGHV